MASDSEKLEFIQRVRSGNYAIDNKAKSVVVAEAVVVPLSRLDMLAEELIEIVIEKLKKQ